MRGGEGYDKFLKNIKKNYLNLDLIELVQKKKELH